jgi:predicted fused transcriptional regulator/phosphomethylpyrimidine kinase
MAYHDDVEEAMEKCKASVLTLDRHSKAGPEELSRKWNISLVMVKATLDVTIQHGV